MAPFLSTPQGVPSLIFHLSDRGGGDLSVVGPPGTDEYMASIRAFVNRRHPAQHIFPVSPCGEPGGAFRYSTSDDGPAPFAWAQAKTPGAGLEIIALPFSASPHSSQSADACAGAQGPPAAHASGLSRQESEPERGAKRARMQQGTAEAGERKDMPHAGPCSCVCVLGISSSAHDVCWFPGIRCNVAFACVITGPSRRAPEAASGLPPGNSKTGTSRSVVVAVECTSAAAAKRAVMAVSEWLASRQVQVLRGANERGE